MTDPAFARRAVALLDLTDLSNGLDEAGVEYLEESGTSIYFRDPNGARLELIADPLGEMYGTKVL